MFIVCSNKILNHVLLSGEDNENLEKTLGLISKKKQLCTWSTLFYAHFFAVVQVLHDHNVQLSETS